MFLCSLYLSLSLTPSTLLPLCHDAGSHWKMIFDEWHAPANHRAKGAHKRWEQKIRKELNLEKEALSASYELITTHRVTSSENRFVLVRESGGIIAVYQQTQAIHKILFITFRASQIDVGPHTHTHTRSALTHTNHISLFVDTRSPKNKSSLNSFSYWVCWIMGLMESWRFDAPPMLECEKNRKTRIERKEKKKRTQFSPLFSTSLVLNPKINCVAWGDERHHYFPPIF